MIEYVFRDGVVLAAFNDPKHADPQRLGEALAKIKRTEAGLPEDLIAAAKADKRNPWHRQFNWDDAAEAHASRLSKARNMLGTLRIISEETGEKEPAYVNVCADKGRAYFSTAQVKTSADLRLALMKQARREIASAQARFRMLSDLIGADLGEAIAKLDQHISAAETRVAAA